MKVNHREVPDGQIEDTSEYDETRDELFEKLSDLIDDNLFGVVEAICILFPGGHSSLKHWICKYTGCLNNDEISTLIKAVEAK